MTQLHTTNYGITYADDLEPLANYPAVTQAVAQTLDAALGRGGVAPYDATSLAAEAAARVALAARVAVLETRATVSLTAAQTLTGNTTTALSFGAQSALSTAGMWASTAATRLKPPADGEYDLAVSLDWGTSANQGALIIGYRLNGGTVVNIDTRPSYPYSTYTSDSWQSATIRGIVLHATDYLEVIAFQNSDSSRSVKIGSTATLSRAR